MSISQLILTHIKLSKTLWYNDIHTLKMRENIVVLLHIREARTVFLVCMMTLWWPRHWIWVIGNTNDQVSTYIHTYKNIPKALWESYIHTLLNGKKYCADFSYLCS